MSGRPFACPHLSFIQSSFICLVDLFLILPLQVWGVLQIKIAPNHPSVFGSINPSVLDLPGTHMHTWVRGQRHSILKQLDFYLFLPMFSPFDLVGDISASCPDVLLLLICDNVPLISCALMNDSPLGSASTLTQTYSVSLVSLTSHSSCIRTATLWTNWSFVNLWPSQCHNSFITTSVSGLASFLLGNNAQQHGDSESNNI